MGKGEKFMVVHKAKIIEKSENHFLKLIIDTQELEIPLTEDKPKEVKKVFNELIKELKKEKFEFSLETVKEDLYYHICSEYIKQLNQELDSVYNDLDAYNLIENE